MAEPIRTYHKVFMCLFRQFLGRNKHQCSCASALINSSLPWQYLLDNRYEERSRLARPSPRSRHDILAVQGQRNGAFLNQSRFFPSQFRNGLEKRHCHNVIDGKNRKSKILRNNELLVYWSPRAFNIRSSNPIWSKLVGVSSAIIWFEEKTTSSSCGSVREKTKLKQEINNRIHRRPNKIKWNQAINRRPT